MTNRMWTINPDDLLETPEGRIWTPERNAAAWAQCYAALAQAITDMAGDARVILVCGIQGAGKTSWIATQPPVPGVLYFDAALPGIRHRAKIIAIARDGGAAIEAVWIDTPLATALARNAGRSPDKVVPADAIRSVAAQFEGPSLAEGFDRIRVYTGEPLALWQDSVAQSGSGLRSSSEGS